MEMQMFILILLFLIQHYSLSVSSVSSNETDQQALLAFENLVTSPSHFLANNWTRNTSFCSWFGVTCSSKRQRVVALSLPNLQLQGTISTSLANLSFLRELNLVNNNFRGGIPYDLGHLPRLQVIDLQNNQLNGSIPANLFQHQKVQKISLAFNKLSGEIWKGPCYVPELRILNLRNNSLTGVIPPSIKNATKLLNFSLSGNRINGNIPKEIGNLSQLAFLSLVDNQLTEYGSEGIVSTSGDVYSYGIILMEVLAGRRPTDEEIFNENLGLREWIRRAFPRSIMEVVDPNLFPEEEQITSKSEICIICMIELALDCTKEMSESRITMRDVVKKLNKIKNTFLEK